MLEMCCSYGYEAVEANAHVYAYCASKVFFRIQFREMGGGEVVKSTELKEYRYIN